MASTSRSTLRRRLRQHYRDNGSASSLRFTRGTRLSIPLRAPIAKLDLPFNLDMNRAHRFWPALSRVRREARSQGRCASS